MLSFTQVRELAVKDAFKDKELDKKAQEQLSSEFYLFKKATLKWQLFKKYGKITGQEALPCKRGQGTRWVTHQLAAIDVHIRNLATMLAFTNEPIETTYNSTMKSERSHLEGIRKAHVIYHYYSNNVHDAMFWLMLYRVLWLWKKYHFYFQKLLLP